VGEMMQAMLEVVEKDNEDNAVTAIKIIMELHKV
jgi:predicted translin family RNA/ssDNA-binding protein